MRIDVVEFSFFGKRGQRMPLTLNQPHQFSELRSSLWQLNMCGWQYKQRWIDALPRGGGKKPSWEEGKEWVREDWEMKVAAWHRECDSVMQTGFIVSPQCPGEIISSQYGVYQSSQNTTFPSRYMSRLSASLCAHPSVCLSAPQIYTQSHQKHNWEIFCMVYILSGPKNNLQQKSKESIHYGSLIRPHSTPMTTRVR